MTHVKSVKPFKNKGDRLTQLRALLANKVTPSELIGWGFVPGDIADAKASIERRSDGMKRETNYVPKDLVRCKECGCKASKKTFKGGVCLGCAHRHEVNSVRCGMFRV